MVRTVTLAANTAYKLSVTGEWNHVAVFHRGNVTEDLYATLKGADPVADADDVYCVPSGARRELHWQNQTGNDVRLICATAAKVEVELA